MVLHFEFMTVLAFNKRANYDYEIREKYEAGLVLLGHEVKSVKTGHISLKGSFVTLRQAQGRLSKKQDKLSELYLVNAHIPLYNRAGIIKDYDPYRSRKLLLKKSEIKHLIGKKQEQGLTLVPIKIYTRRSFIKLEFGIGRGKKKIDKREMIKKREVERSMRTAIKRGIRA